jgi:hypothetical protein
MTVHGNSISRHHIVNLVVCRAEGIRTSDVNLRNFEKFDEFFLNSRYARVDLAKRLDG